MSSEERYLTEREVSKIFRRAPSTLRNDRHRRRGLPYQKIGRQVLYRLSDINAYLEATRIEPEGMLKGS